MPQCALNILAAAAGLLVLACLPGCDDSDNGGAQEDPAALAKMELTDTAAWKRIAAAWAEAEAAVADSSGLDDRQLRRLHQAVADAGADVDLLVKADLLGGTEAALLKEGLDLLADRLPRPYVAEAPVYVTPPLPIRGNIRRLKERLPLLEWLADHEKPHPAVIEKALEATERDITLLADADQLRPLPPAEQAEAERTRRQAQACVAKIKARLAAATPEPQP
jgi:hypothetical protein